MIELWIGLTHDGEYQLGNNPENWDLIFGFVNDGYSTMNHQLFNSLFPDIKLKQGADPVKVMMSMQLTDTARKLSPGAHNLQVKDFPKEVYALKLRASELDFHMTTKVLDEAQTTAGFEMSRAFRQSGPMRKKKQ